MSRFHPRAPLPFRGFKASHTHTTWGSISRPHTHTHTHTHKTWGSKLAEVQSCLLRTQSASLWLRSKRAALGLTQTQSSHTIWTSRTGQPQGGRVTIKSSANTVLKAMEQGLLHSPSTGPQSRSRGQWDCGLGPRPPTEHWGKQVPELEPGLGGEVID